MYTEKELQPFIDEYLGVTDVKCERYSRRTQAGHSHKKHHGFDFI